MTATTLLRVEGGGLMLILFNSFVLKLATQTKCTAKPFMITWELIPKVLEHSKRIPESEYSGYSDKPIKRHKNVCHKEDLSEGLSLLICLPISVSPGSRTHVLLIRSKDLYQRTS
jgi:hypothetical protein